jgi:hypothetical protein
LGTFLKVLKALGIDLCAADAKTQSQARLTTSGEACDSNAFPKAARVPCAFSYVPRMVSTYRPGVCPLDPQKRCLDVVPCTPLGAAMALPAFPVATWAPLSVADEVTVYAA